MCSSDLSEVLSKRVVMPHIPLRCKLLEELDDVDHSFKCAQLLKYLQDMSIEAFIPLPSAGSDSNSADISSVSSISSISSVSSVSGDPDEASFNPFSSLALADIKEMYASAIQANINKLCYHILTSRVLRKNPTIEKASQIHLLESWHNGNLN